MKHKNYNLDAKLVERLCEFLRTHNDWVSAEELHEALQTAILNNVDCWHADVQPTSQPDLKLLWLKARLKVLRHTKIYNETVLVGKQEEKMFEELIRLCDLADEAEINFLEQQMGERI